MQVQQKTPFEAQVGTPVGATSERRTGWMWALMVVLGGAMLVLGATLVYPAVTSTSGEAVMNDMMDAWNSGNITTFPDIYDANATMSVSGDGTKKGLGAIEHGAGEAQAQGDRRGGRG